MGKAAGSPRLEAMFQRAVAMRSQPKIDVFDVKRIHVGPILTEKTTGISTRTITVWDGDGKEAELVLHTKYNPIQLLFDIAGATT